MSRFLHKTCPVCRAPFESADEIVVCPDCGTPHHRNCWLKNNKCGLESYHAEGFEWNGLLPDQLAIAEAQRQKILADKQANPDPHHAEYPQGVPLAPEPVDVDKLVEEVIEMQRNPSDERGEDGVSMHELYNFTGGSLHYLGAFAFFRHKANQNNISRNISINICAALLKPLNQFYRRLDGLGIALTLWEFLSTIPYVLINAGFYAENEAMLNSLYILQLLCNIISFGIIIVLCLFGDYFYYRTAVRRIKKIRENYDDGKAEGYFERLSEKGKPSILRMIVALLLIAIVVALLYVFLPTGALTGLAA